ncbi:MAG: sulfite exporter TauE/SafE family protein [Phycisphaerales bacterium]|nr:sulfite exporter TauE/SafE family protein [Phycisphaerales bacterium]
MIMSLIAIALVALIAYWWSNEGAFSALLHLVCVIMAGAIALALWEPILFDLLAAEGKYAGLLPGVILLSVFVVALLLLRKAADLAAPDAAFLPEVPNVVIGGIFGLISGTLTVGIVLVGTGFIHRPLELMGYKGWHRVTGAPDAQGMVSPPESGLLVPFDTLTVGFYELLSSTTLKPDLPGSIPLAWANPDLDRMSSLIRDTIHGDQGKMGGTWMPPSAIKSADAQTSEYVGSDQLLVVTATVDKSGFDFRGGLLLPSSQVRVIGTVNGKTEAFHPAGWSQLPPAKKKSTSGGQIPTGSNADKSEEEEAPQGQIFRMFSGDEMFATSPTARGAATLKFAFVVPNGFTPRYIQIRSARRSITAKNATRDGLMLSMGAADKVDRGIVFGGDITSKVSSGAQASRFGRGFRATTQDIKQAGGELNEDRRVVTVNSVFRPRSGAQAGSGALKPKGYHVDEGAALVRIEVLSGESEEIQDLADIFLAAREFRLPADARIQLLNDRNEHWNPIGFELITDSRTTVVYRDTEIVSINDLRARPRTGSNDKFYLLFEVPEGTVLSELRLDEEVIGTISGKIAERYVR